jgi:hypothetical protein
MKCQRCHRDVSLILGEPFSEYSNAHRETFYFRMVNYVCENKQCEHTHEFKEGITKKTAEDVSAKLDSTFGNLRQDVNTSQDLRDIDN